MYICIYIYIYIYIYIVRNYIVLYMRRRTNIHCHHHNNHDALPVSSSCNIIMQYHHAISPSSPANGCYCWYWLCLPVLLTLGEAPGGRAIPKASRRGWLSLAKLCNFFSERLENLLYLPWYISPILDFRFVLLLASAGRAEIGHLSASYIVGASLLGPGD